MIKEIVESAINNINAERSDDEKIVFQDDEALFGENSKLDSLTLVSLIMDVEMLLSENGIEISLTDDENMSSMDSPFATVGNFIIYINSLVN